MQPSLEKLRKFFRLEHENKYQNTAIIGGLAKMLDYWEGEARADEITEEVIQAVVARLRSYEKISPDGRLNRLREFGNALLTPTPKRDRNLNKHSSLSNNALLYSRVRSRT